jgi:hypothetical protein
MGKSTDTDRSVTVQGWKARDTAELMAKGYGVSFRGDKNVLKSQ